jgi:hypothetical protein
MRILNSKELECVSGGDWHIGFDFGVVDGWAEGDESPQEILQGAGNVISDAYWTARDATADLYEWIASGWAYSASCGYGY